MPIENEFDPSENNPFIGEQTVPHSTAESQSSSDTINTSPKPKPSLVEHWSELSKGEKGRVIGAGAAAALIGVTGATGVLPKAIESITPEEVSTQTITVTVQPGDGLQKIVEENYTFAGDWRDKADEIKALNPDLFTPGYILQPGDTLSIPVETK